MKKGKPATIKEIAKKLKISPSTVSRALNDHPSIGLVTTMRVKKVAEELNYEPNQTAIFFKQRKTFTIGVIVPSLLEPFFSEAITAIENVSSKFKYTVLMGQSLDDEKRELQIIQTFRKHRVDGILMSIGKNTKSFELIEVLKEADIPVVFFDCVPSRSDVHRVYSNLSTGIGDAVHALIDRGHQNIALINGPENLLASKERNVAFKAALEREKISVDSKYIVQSDLTELGNQLAIEQLLVLPDRPSAIISFNDFVTLDVMKYSRSKGVVVNQDMHFISFANYPFWKYIENPPMGSIEQYPDKQAEKAAEILFEILGKKVVEIPTQDVVFNSKLVLH